MIDQLHGCRLLKAVGIRRGDVSITFDIEIMFDNVSIFVVDRKMLIEDINYFAYQLSVFNSAADQTVE